MLKQKFKQFLWYFYFVEGPVLNTIIILIWKEFAQFTFVQLTLYGENVFDW